jgi:hypothetical protein
MCEIVKIAAGVARNSHEIQRLVGLLSPAGHGIFGLGGMLVGIGWLFFQGFSWGVHVYACLSWMFTYFLGRKSYVAIPKLPYDIWPN